MLGAPTGSGLAVPPADRLAAGQLSQYDAYVELMQACWARVPEERPTMADVATRLRAILNAGAWGALPALRRRAGWRRRAQPPFLLCPGLADHG